VKILVDAAAVRRLRATTQDNGRCHYCGTPTAPTGAPTIAVTAAGNPPPPAAQDDQPAADA